MENIKNKKKITLIPYGFLGVVGAYLMSYFFEEGSTGFNILSILAFVSVIAMIIHAIKLINQYIRYVSYKNWERNYICSNPEHNKTKEELESIFYKERNSLKAERMEALKREKLERDKKKLEEKEKMERLRNAGRTVHPSEQVSNQPSYVTHANNVACCPKCGSTSITGNKKGFGIGKAVVGAWAVGPIGLVAGNKGAKKVIVTCLNCGKQWKAGK